jgi:hypothetical protein
MSSDEEGLAAWMKKQKDQTAPFETARGTGCVRMMVGGGSGKHIHFDVFSPEATSRKMKAEAKGALAQIQETTNRLFAKEVDVNLMGGFKAKLEELPETGMIRSLVFQTKMGNVAIKLSGAKFSIEGAPVQEITWQSTTGDKVAINRICLAW